MFFLRCFLSVIVLIFYMISKINIESVERHSLLVASSLLSGSCLGVQISKYHFSCRKIWFVVNLTASCYNIDLSELSKALKFNTQFWTMTVNLTLAKKFLLLERVTVIMLHNITFMYYPILLKSWWLPNFKSISL